MHTKVLRGLRIRDAPLLDQPHRLKLELPCKLPSLHDTPPVPSKHLTRCLRNRVQATLFQERRERSPAIDWPFGRRAASFQSKTLSANGSTNLLINNNIKNDVRTPPIVFGSEVS